MLRYIPHLPPPTSDSTDRQTGRQTDISNPKLYPLCNWFMLPTLFKPGGGQNLGARNRLSLPYLSILTKTSTFSPSWEQEADRTIWLSGIGVLRFLSFVGSPESPLRSRLWKGSYLDVTPKSFWEWQNSPKRFWDIIQELMSQKLPQQQLREGSMNGLMAIVCLPTLWIDTNLAK